MGSNQSKLDYSNTEQARIKAYAAELLRQKAQLKKKELQWQQEQNREQHWNVCQKVEKHKQKKTLQEWERQADLKSLESQQQDNQLEEQKLDELNVQQQSKESRVLRQQVKIRREQQFKQVPTTVAPTATPLASFGMRETEVLQQKVLTGPSTRFPSSIVPREAVAEQQNVSPGSAASPALLIVPKIAVAVKQKVRSGVQPIVKYVPKPLVTQKSYLRRMRKAKVKCNKWSITDYIKDENFLSKQVSENLFELFHDNNTVPFIARYRKHLTQGMNMDKLRAAQHSYDQAKLMKQRAAGIVRDIDNRGLWTPEFHALIHETKSLHDLEYIRSLFITPKSKFLKTATVNGLEIAADACFRNMIPPLAYIVQESVEGLKTQEEVEDGIVCLMADIITKDRHTFDIVNKLRSAYPFKVRTTKAKGADKLNKQINIYEPYFNFTSNERDLKPDQVRDINRGESVNALSVKINIPEVFELEFKMRLMQQYGFISDEPSLDRMLVDDAIDFAYNSSIKDFVANKVRYEIYDKARNSIDSLAQNFQLHFLAPHVRGKVVIGIYPGFKNCKFAVVSEYGNILDTGTICPNDLNNLIAKSEAERVLANMICKHKCTIIALGNGIACKETGIFIISVINKNKNKKILSNVVCTIVDEAYALDYNYTRKAALEFPHVEARILSAVSIARRLQDPMAELVKIEPEDLTIGNHQQDICRRLIVELVSYVGVDVNTASVSLLKNVAGLNEAMANSIIEWRRSSGPFTNRNDLLKVKGINKRTFKQCAGFIRIVPETAMAIGGQTIAQDSFNYLDQTWIHPESYAIAQSFLKDANCNVLELGTGHFISNLNRYAEIGFSLLARKFRTSEKTIEMIVYGLSFEKGQDVRDKRCFYA